MGTKRIAERVAAPFTGCKVDRDKGVIHNALICGPASANGNDYEGKSFGDGSQYRGRHVYLNHNKDRRAEDKVGWFDPESIKFRANGMPEGDFHVLKSHPMAPSILEAAERNPGLFGFSHVARCRTSQGANGRTKVEMVEEVESIDLVAEPATTRGLFESKGKTVAVTFAQFAECITRHPKSTTAQIAKAKRLAEDMGDAGYADAPALDAAPAEDADSGDTITAAFESAIMAIVKDALGKGMDKKAVLKTIGKLLDGHADAQGGGGDSGGGSDGDATTPESKQRQALPESWTVLAECKKAGLKNVTESQLKVLARLTDPKERAQFIAEIQDAMKGGAETPQSAGRESIQEEAHREGKRLEEANNGAGAGKKIGWDD